MNNPPNILIVLLLNRNSLQTITPACEIVTRTESAHRHKCWRPVCRSVLSFPTVVVVPSFSFVMDCPRTVMAIWILFQHGDDVDASQPVKTRVHVNNCNSKWGRSPSRQDRHGVVLTSSSSSMLTTYSELVMVRAHHTTVRTTTTAEAATDRKKCALWMMNVLVEGRWFNHRKVKTKKGTTTDMVPLEMGKGVDAGGGTRGKLLAATLESTIIGICYAYVNLCIQIGSFCQICPRFVWVFGLHFMQ